MNTTDLVHYLSADAPQRHAAPRPRLAPSHYELAAPVRSSIVRARQYLIDEQRLDGSWAGRKTGDVSSLNQLVLLFAFLGRERSELAAQAARAIERDQRPEGGWSLAPGGPIDLDVSVMAYFALKLAGEDANQPVMSRARQAIRQCGGADATGATTRLWLALLGQIEYEHCTPIAPEWLLISAFAGNLSATDQRRLAAFSVVWSLRPRREVELARSVRELFIESPRNWPAQAGYFAEQPSAVLAGLWSRCERIGFVPLRKRALDRANTLLTEAVAERLGREANFEGLAWQWIALAALGHADTSSVIAVCASHMERQVVADVASDEARSQPETSLTADTARAIEALHESGIGVDEPPVAAGVRWLVEHRLKPVSEGNDVRETAALLRVTTCLKAVNEPTDDALPPHIQLAAHRDLHCEPREQGLSASHVDSLRGALMDECRRRQRPDGGWSPGGGADATLCARGVIRACAHHSNAASAPDTTGAMLDAFSCQARPANDVAIARGCAFLRSTQRGDGSWHSAAGARLIHGTAWAIRGLIAAGATIADPVVAAGVNWLLVHQHESGGWGEAGGSPCGPREFLAAEATVSQTAWAVLALVAAGLADHDATRRAIEYLVDQQLGDGAWVETQLTECDSAGGGWYRNDLHSSARPFLALSRWAVAIGKQNHDDKPAGLRLLGDDWSNEI